MLHKGAPYTSVVAGRHIKSRRYHAAAAHPSLHVRTEHDDVIPLFDPNHQLSLDNPDPLTSELFAAISERMADAALREGLVTIKNGQRVVYPLLPSLIQLTALAEEHLARQIPHIVSAWQTLLMAHRTDSQLRDFLAVPPVLREWVDAADDEDYRVDFCRFDLVGDNVETARVVEFNANCPGGVLFTSAYRAQWCALPEVSEILEQWNARSSLLDDRLWFPRFFRVITARDTVAGDSGAIAVFHRPGGNVLELDKMVALFAEAGCMPILADPANKEWLNHDVQTGYLKYGIQAVLSDIAQWSQFLERVSTGKLRLLNPLPGRWIGDNKLCLAAMSDPRFSYLFTPRQREAIGMLIPYSRKTGNGIEPARLISERASWVVKGPYDTQGNSVFIGSEHTPEQWRSVIRRAVEGGWLAQEAVPPSPRTWRGKAAYQDLSVVLLGGRFAGYTSRVSENLRVNVAQGGGRQVVFGHHGTDWGDHAL